VIQQHDEAPYCLDTQRCDAAGEYPVVCFELHHARAGSIARSFADWVERFFVILE
jgi:hypothetical protein